MSSMHSRTCPKCGGSMTEGFVVDHTHGGAGIASWVEGAPVKSIWVGLKLRGKKTIPVTVWRCGRCGLLESFAPG